MGVSVSGNNLTKTAADGWGNAGASSTQTIASGNGYVEFTATETNTHRVCGLSHGDPDQYPNMNFGMYLRADGIAMPLENGTYHWEVQVAYSTGDIFRVAVEGGAVKYKKNGTVFYTSTLAPTYPLLVDTSLFSNGVTLSNVVIGSGSGSSLKYVLQDLQGSTRAVMNNNAGSGTSTIIARHDYLPFGEEIGSGTGLRTDGQGYSTNPWAKDRVRQRYGLTERDDATGLDHTEWRKYESFSGRMTTPDPYGGSMSIGDPQSFNRYSYVQNDPVNFVDPSGLYAACVHEGMTKFLAKLAGYSDKVAGKLGDLAGDKPGGADSFKYSATNPINIIKGFFGRGPSARIHFASEATLAKGIANFGGYMALRTDAGYQQAAFVTHSIEDVHGAHQGYHLPFGHAFKGSKPDLIIGDAKFLQAANEVYQLLSGDQNASLTAQQVNDLIDAIIAACGKKANKLQITRPAGGGHGGGLGGGSGGGGGGWGWDDDPFRWLDWWWRSLNPPTPPTKPTKLA